LSSFKVDSLPIFFYFFVSLPLSAFPYLLTPYYCFQSTFFHHFPPLGFLRSLGALGNSFISHFFFFLPSFLSPRFPLRSLRVMFFSRSGGGVLLGAFSPYVSMALEFFWQPFFSAHFDFRAPWVSRDCRIGEFTPLSPFRYLFVLGTFPPYQDGTIIYT